MCPNLFELDSDDGVRNWGIELKPVTTRIGSASTNKWLQDPIPDVMPNQNNFQAGSSAGRTTIDASVVNLNNFNDCMLVVDNAIKHDVLAAQTAMQAKHDTGGVGCQIQLLPSSSTRTSASNLHQGHSIVLGLPAAPFTFTGAKHPPSEGDGILDDAGSELKKRKRVLALQNGESSFAAVGVVGNDVIGTNVSVRGDSAMNVISNPLYDEQNVIAGPDDQVCQGK